MSHELKQLQEAYQLHQHGRLLEAAGICERLIRRDSKNYDALHLLGVINAASGNYAEAKLFLERSLATQHNKTAYNENYATILFQAHDYELTVKTCRQAIELHGRTETLQYVLAISLYKHGRLREALEEFAALLLANPRHLAGNNELGSVLAELGRYEEALSYISAAIKIEPRYAEAFFNKGNVLRKLKKNDAAMAAYAEALRLNPNVPDFHLGMGDVLRETKRSDTALVAYDQALLLNADLPEAWLGRGLALADLNRHDEAVAAYDKALLLKPGMASVEGYRLAARMQACDWDGIASDRQRLIESIRKPQLSAEPFLLLNINSSLADQYDYARLWVKERLPAAGQPLWTGEIYRHDRIRVGYVSSDFHEHATAYLMAGVFERHDRSKFETLAISIGRKDNSSMRRRLEGSFEQFINVGTLSDREAAEKIRSAEIDILIDLKGYTRDARTTIFCHRPAPIQVNYLGYPGTMGADYIDYIIADAVVIPDSHRGCYAEKILRLPNSYQPNDSKRSISERVFSKNECGLPEEAFVFCCFNNNYKITPETFDGWMRILSQVKDSVLWLLGDNGAASNNLKREAELRGVSAARLVFAKRAPPSDHLSRHRLADLFLDTLPYNAHTTASDALWTGLPVLTQIGETFAGRVAASLLNAIGLPELVTKTPEEYERMAICLAADRPKLAAIKRDLADKRRTMPLFDTALFTGHIEAAYVAMYARYQAGLAPDHIDIPD